MQRFNGKTVVVTGASSGIGEGIARRFAANGAVVNFTRGLAFDLGQFGIRVNAVAPSLTINDDHPALGQYSGLIARFNERRALTGYSTPADIAGAVTFLASDDARFIAGTVLPVDGGITSASGQPNLF